MEKTQCTKHHHVLVGSHTPYNININIIFPLLLIGYYRPCIPLLFYYKTKVL